MKLAKALKEKNRLVGEVNRLKGLIMRDNSLETKYLEGKNRTKQWLDYTAAVEALVAIKTAIFKANTGIYRTIVLMSEKKAELGWITSLNTTNGVQETPNYRGEGVIKTEYSAYITQDGIDTRIVELQKEIARLQDELDEFNATVTIEI